MLIWLEPSCASDGGKCITFTALPLIDAAYAPCSNKNSQHASRLCKAELQRLLLMTVFGPMTWEDGYRARCLRKRLLTAYIKGLSITNIECASWMELPGAHKTEHFSSWRYAARD